MPEFHYQELFSLGKDKTPYRKLTDKYVSTIEVDGREILKIEPEALELLSAEAMRDVAHLLRPEHLKQLVKILGDDEASENDKFVATELLKNANVAAGMVLPSCQDTGTAIIMGKKGKMFGHPARIKNTSLKVSTKLTPKQTCGILNWPRSACLRKRTLVQTSPPRSISTLPTAAHTNSCS